MIRIGKPFISHYENSTRMVSKIIIDKKETEIYYEVNKKYLSFELADSFVVAILPLALKIGVDIKSEAPISVDLLNQLRIMLVPSLAKFHFNTEPINIFSPLLTPFIKKGEGIGTGLSSGVDSFDTIASNF